MKVAIIGCGPAGEAIASSLDESPMVSVIELNNRSPEKAEALSKKLRKARPVKLEELVNPDCVILAASGMSQELRKSAIAESSTCYEARRQELPYNLSSIKLISSRLKRLPRSKIILLTNPVDEMTNYLNMLLNREDVVGFGMELDSARYSKSSGRKTICVGLHGDSVPLMNYSTLQEYQDLMARVDRDILKLAREKGIPYEQTGAIFRNFFERFFSDKKDVLSFSYFLKQSYYGISNVAISLPFEVQNGKVLGHEGTALNPWEFQLFGEFSKLLKQDLEAMKFVDSCHFPKI
jgi:malate/lactate dehydrogenase